MKSKTRSENENSQRSETTQGNGLTKEGEWLTSSFNGPLREIGFRVVCPTGAKDPQGKKLTRSLHTETIESTASDAFLSSFAKFQIEQLQQVEHVCALARNARPPSASTPAVKLFAIHVRDVQSDVACAPVMLPGFGADTVETFRASLIAFFKAHLNRHISQLYLAMIAEVERRDWRFNDLSRGRRAQERWREICEAVHPLWLTDDMTERERGDFEQRSHDTILKNLRTGRFKSKNYDKKRTECLTSHKKPDEITRVRKSAKKIKRTR